MKRIVVIAQGLSDGGAERIASVIANHFSFIGHKVLYIAVYNEKKEYPLDEKIMYRFVNAQGKGRLAIWINRSLIIKKFVKEFKADIVFSFVQHELIPLIFSDIPVIPSLRNDPKSTERGLLWKLTRDFTYANSYKVIFQTEGARDYFGKKTREKGVIIGNPLNEDLPYWSENNHKKVFVTACRISTQKNLPMLIEAFAQFSKTHPDYTLEIYGEGPADYREELEQFAAKCGAKDKILFMGRSTTVYEHMQKAEAFVLTSDYEGLSNSMLEAMAIGVPCICTDCPPGGAREYMEKREAGILVPVGGVEQLIKAMCRIADDAKYRQKLSRNEKYVRNELTKEKICEKWASLITD